MFDLLRKPRPADPDAIVMTVDELVMRFESGNRFRLVSLLYTWPTFAPEKIGGQWPLITEACWAIDPGPREALIVTEDIDYAHGAYPGDTVAVILVHPAQVALAHQVLATAGC